MAPLSSVLLEDTPTCGQNEPPTLRLVDNSTYLLSLTFVFSAFATFSISSVESSSSKVYRTIESNRDILFFLFGFWVKDTTAIFHSLYWEI